MHLYNYFAKTFHVKLEMMLVCISSAKFWILEKNKHECKRGNKRLCGLSVRQTLLALLASHFA